MKNRRNSNQLLSFSSIQMSEIGFQRAELIGVTSPASQSLTHFITSDTNLTKWINQSQNLTESGTFQIPGVMTCWKLANYAIDTSGNHIQYIICLLNVNISQFRVLSPQSQNAISDISRSHISLGSYLPLYHLLNIPPILPHLDSAPISGSHP